MRDFSWKVFAMTGDVESYLLYKEMMRHDDGWNGDEDDEWPEDDGDWTD